MRDKKRKPNRETKRRVKDALENRNVAAAINISGGNARRSVSSMQRIVQKTGETTKVTEVSRSEAAD